MEDRILSGRYRIIAHLARGGMADVYEAEDTLLNRSVAVKLLHANFASDDAFVARFRREAQAAANLSHPNIVAIYDWGQDEGTYFMVMELVRGRTLREVVKSEGPLLPRRAAEIASEASAALSVAHQHGVFHRDVKPGNILLTEDGTVKVTDFGIARALDDSEELTRTGAVIGTATYFSPEQAQGLPADERSDVYSLGIVLYEMLAGRPPFTGESPVAVAYQHVSELPPPPDSINTETPRELAAVAEQAIRKNPKERYQTADEIRADLLRYLAGNEPLAAQAFLATSPTSMITQSSAPPPATLNSERGGAFSEPLGRRNQVSYWSAIGVLIAILAVGLWLLVRLLSGGEPAIGTVEIPNLANIIAEEAFETLQEMDLKVKEIKEMSDEFAVGYVIRTNPPSGSNLEPGSFVDVIISTGPEEFSTPNVLEENVDVARARIEAQGFTIGTIEYVLADDIDENTVIAQSPDGGVAASPGTEVSLIVSSGPSSIKVPDVSGKSTETAILELAHAGFKNIETKAEFSAVVLEGFVIETNPAVDQVAPRDATILVLVSQGPEPVEIPDLEGMTTEQAEQALNALGLLLLISPDTIEVPLASGLVGSVTEQDPVIGVIVEMGTEVVVKLGVIQQILVPDVTAIELAVAQVEMSNVGLILDITGTVPTADLTLDNTIATQDPLGGSTIAEGSFVNAELYTHFAIVPNFIGMSLVDAQVAADAVGIGLINQAGVVPDPGGMAGIIESQTISEGTTIIVGTTIDVTVYG